MASAAEIADATMSELLISLSGTLGSGSLVGHKLQSCFAAWGMMHRLVTQDCLMSAVLSRKP